eukprot:CAMPEP_0198148084 /NCGR_PEP_ID=MMETSP1443-20131203/39678_1 /TAXON_ID=186043 /ORGANISM="Entomoneis sp., Strain CCMP2396" /LENGTH=204 /DNA_ID=CAMNT_0043812669 /DNA_START=196 /DNA_END=810 /DNA_ORIENTATION=+
MYNSRGDGRRDHPSRRDLLASSALQVAVPLSVLLIPTNQANAAQPNGIQLTESPCGLKWADPKQGTGEPLKVGSPVSIDYSMASTAGRFPQIYTTKNTGAAYRWTLGDGSTIAGMEMAILGNEAEGIPPMQPGGIRRVIIPAALGFQRLAEPNAKCVDGGAEGSIGPIPPKVDGAYQRWYQFYCNPRIPYQPDLVVDIKLYGKR